MVSSVSCQLLSLGPYHGLHCSRCLSMALYTEMELVRVNIVKGACQVPTALYPEMGLVRVNIVADACQRHCILKWDLSGLTLLKVPANSTVS